MLPYLQGKLARDTKDFEAKFARVVALSEEDLDIWKSPELCRPDKNYQEVIKCLKSICVEGSKVNPLSSISVGGTSGSFCSLQLGVGLNELRQV